VTVFAFEVAPTDDPRVFAIDVECSAGTYVRTLAADLGQLLGGGAHLRDLRRTAVGPFTIEEARPPDTVELLPPVEALRALPTVVVDGDVVPLIANGRVLPAPEGTGPWALVDGSGRLLAVYEAFGAGRAKPAVVLAGVEPSG
jgi:tRNA pseudouridine55 synthase